MGPRLVERVTGAGRWLSVVSVLCILGWAVPAALMLGRGFAVEDEGSYVLSYRFWDSNPYFVSGSQYFYGPIFEAIGENIPLLRVLRLLMVVAANGWFAWTFLTWLTRERHAPLPGSRTGLLLLMTASGGMAYLFAPLTPGYYDLTADACLVLVSLMFVTLARAPRVPHGVPVATGVVAVLLLVTKWTAVPALVPILGSALWTLARTDGRAARRYLALVAAGAAAALLAVQVFLVPLGRFVPVLRRVSSLTAVQNHSLGYLLRRNVSSTLEVVVGALLLSVLLLLGLTMARHLSRNGRPGAARTWLVAAAVVSTLVLPFALGWRGGDERGRVVVSVALGGLLAAFVAALLSRPDIWSRGGRGRPVAAVLLLVPFLQATGTNVVLPYVAVECLAMWVALALMLVVDGDAFPVASTAVLVDLAVLVVATAMVAGTTTLQTPFRTDGFQDDTASVPELGLRVPPTTVGRYHALETALAPYVVRGSTPMITLDEKAGLTYLLGAVPVGSTWTDQGTPTRTAGIVELACRNGDLSTGGPPVLLTDRPIDRYLRHALDVCGVDYPAAYRRLRVPGGPPGLTVLVPRAGS